MGYHSVQNNETGKIYHLSKNLDGTGNHMLISSNFKPVAGTGPVNNNGQAANPMMPASVYGGAFGSRRSHTKDQLLADSSKSIMIQRDFIQPHNGAVHAHSLAPTPTEQNS